MMAARAVRKNEPKDQKIAGCASSYKVAYTHSVTLMTTR
jgi:hypothetical protein